MHTGINQLVVGRIEAIESTVAKLAAGRIGWGIFGDDRGWDHEDGRWLVCLLISLYSISLSLNSRQVKLILGPTPFCRLMAWNQSSCTADSM